MIHTKITVNQNPRGLFSLFFFFSPFSHEWLISQSHLPGGGRAAEFWTEEFTRIPTENNLLNFAQGFLIPFPAFSSPNGSDYVTLAQSCWGASSSHRAKSWQIRPKPPRSASPSRSSSCQPVLDSPASMRGDFLGRPPQEVPSPSFSYYLFIVKTLRLSSP